MFTAMEHTFEIEEIDGPRGCKHQAVIYRNGVKVSTHRTRMGSAAAEKEARSTIRFYEKQAARDARHRRHGAAQ